MKMQGPEGKCKDEKENARTKRKMQGRHKKLFLGSLRASRAIKNECNSIKNLTTLCPGIKCHSRFLSYFDTSMTIANASNGILKNTQSERPFKQIIVASLSTSLSCSRHSVWFSNETEAISKLEIERKFSGYNKGKFLLDHICNRG